MKQFEHYRVGGFVRDTLLGRPAVDIDYVVINESPESMIERGFLQVGEFPVFLHPVTQDEYALARSERSTGDGYADFEYVWDGVSLSEDLKRRDCTINAIAMTETGDIIDPHNGQADLQAGVLRHVSPHFIEDPLRIFRVARFAARYDFLVADETKELMASMVAQNMLESLSAERFWAETEKALMSTNPRRFFEVLDACGALQAVFPELFVMKGIPQRADYHAEGDVWVHTLMVLDEAVTLSSELPPERALRVRVAALLHDLGKPLTDHEYLYHEDGSVRGMHPGHDDPDRFGSELDSLAERIRMPGDYKQFAYRVALAHQEIHRIRDMSGRGLVNLYDKLDLGRTLRHDSSFLDDVAMTCFADNLGRRTLMPDGSHKQPTSYRQAAWFKDIMTQLHALPVGEWMQAAMVTRERPAHIDAEQATAKRVKPPLDARAKIEAAKTRVLGKRRAFANQWIHDLTESLTP